MHITLSEQTLIVIALVLLCLLLIAHRIGQSRRKRRLGGPSIPRTRSRGSLIRGSGSRVARNSRDHGLTVARKYGRERSPEWPRVEKEHLLRQPACQVCGHQGRGVQVHHMKPFHLYPQLELDPSNLITLCEIKGRDHHLLIGHLDDWESYNPNVRSDTRRYHKENAQQIRSNPEWQREMEERPRPHP